MVVASVPDRVHRGGGHRDVLEHPFAEPVCYTHVHRFEVIMDHYGNGEALSYLDLLRGFYRDDLWWVIVE